MHVGVINAMQESRVHKGLKILVFLLLLAFYGSLLLHKIDLPVADDLPRHMKNGEMILSGHFEVLYANVYSYTEPDFPFVNHHWLSGVVFYLVHQAAGWNGLVIFKVIVLLAAFSLLFFTALRKADFWLVALFSIPTILILAERTNVRPEIFSYFFVAAYLYLLANFEEHPERNQIFWLIPLQLLWVNLHIFFIIGIMLIGGFLVENMIMHRKDLKNNVSVKKLCILLLAVMAVSLVNPNGWSGVLQPLRVFNDYGMAVSENQSIPEFLETKPLREHIPIAIFAPTTFLLAASFIFCFKNKPIFYFLAAIGTSIAGFFILRMLPFLGFIFLPAASQNFNGLFVGIKERLRCISPHVEGVFGKLFAVLFMFALVFLAILGTEGKILVNRKPGTGLVPYAEDAALFFKEHLLKGPIFNDYDSGSYLIYYLFPKEKVFVDNRPEAYPSSFFSGHYLPIFENEAAWQEVYQKYHFNVIFFYQYDEGFGARPFLWKRARDPAWALVYADRYNVIFVRNTPENQDVIGGFQITPQNVEKRLAHLVNSHDFDDQVAVADIFNLIGRADLGEAMFLNVLARWPDKGKIWMILGEELQLVNNSQERSLLSVTYLEKAIALGWGTTEAYTFLGAAYIDIGHPEKAREVLQKALDIDPDREDAKKIMEWYGLHSQ